MCHLRMAVMYLPTKFCANSSIQFGVIDIFRNPRLRPPPCSIFKSCKFGTFRHVNSVMLELYIKFGSNTCDSHRDQHTYAPDIQTYCVPGIRLIYTPLFIIIMTSHKKNFLFRVLVKHSFDDVTRINFRFRLLVTCSSPRRRDASSHII